MSKLKILIVEDEMIIAESVSDMLEELGYEVMGICIRAKQALEKIIANPPDLALFDIQLKGEESGIWLAEQIKETAQFPFIFLTSFGDKATIDLAVNMSPYGYLLKPVDKQHLYGAIEVARQKFVDMASEENEGLVEDKHFFVKNGFQYTKVRVSEIDYIRSDNNYLEVYVSGECHLVRSTLKDFQDQLSKSHFLQVHRSYVINTLRVDKYDASTISFGEKIVPISRSYRQNLVGHFKGSSGKPE